MAPVKQHHLKIQDFIEFIRLEYATQEKQTEALWQLPLQDRVAAGEALSGISVVEVSANGKECLVKFGANQSKLRKGDYLLLHRGNISGEHKYNCTVTGEEDDGLLLQAGWQNSFSGIFPKSGWVLDRDKVNLESLVVPALEFIERTPSLASTFTGLFNGTLALQQDDALLAPAMEFVQSAGLNATQQQAFLHAAGSMPVSLVQGPPGTGKTHVLARLAEFFVQQGKRVLVTAFTHRAINHALKKIKQLTTCEHVIKVGQVYRNEGLEACDEIPCYEALKDWPGLLEQASNGYVAGATCFAHWSTFGREGKRLQCGCFDVIIFDEASQLTAPVALLAMARSSKLIFIGDHRQMAPVITGDHQLHLKKSVFEMLFTHYPGQMLDTTFRMSRAINHFPSEKFYEGRLQSIPDTENHHAAFCQRFRPGAFNQMLSPEKPVVFADLHHTNCDIRSTEEADLLARLVTTCLQAGETPDSLAVIVPYRAQAREIKELLKKSGVNAAGKVTVDTVERMQGQERDIIFLSLTTSDPEHVAQTADFYLQPNRLNVAITRARFKLVLVGSSALFDAKLLSGRHMAGLKLFRELYEQSEIVDARNI